MKKEKKERKKQGKKETKKEENNRIATWRKVKNTMVFLIGRKKDCAEFKNVCIIKTLCWQVLEKQLIMNIKVLRELYFWVDLV